ncbi:Aste57867_21326 [Aphanomyces stellatus]|uniref:Aste57867_21326 protein n=1 Tax=Aphanomyces stellatus TaxID=120398 RepID=A0A485LHA1_9STRA|nr:hypothetical protein As57867_021257 [Aphanomyces stellatus]VFT97998.1 Aste57867_21326 [Aphanomyces stellatus]
MVRVQIALFALVAAVCAAPAPAPCADAPAGWSSVLGGLTQVSVDATQVCGLNAFDNYKVYCSPKKQPAQWWQIVTVNLQQLAMNSGVIYGVRSGDNAFVVGTTDPSCQWTTVATPFGQVASVSYDGTLVCVASTAGRVYCAKSKGGSAALTWQALDGIVTTLAVNGAVLYGVNAQNQLYQGSVSDAACASGSAKWALVTNVSLKQVSWDGARVCGVTPTSQVVCADTPQGSTTPTWTTLPGELTQVSIFQSSLYGVDAAAHVYYKLMPPIGGTAPVPPPVTSPPSPPQYKDWTVVPTPGNKFIDVSSWGSTVCAVDCVNNIYCGVWDPVVPITWTKLSGSLLQLVVYDRGVFGVDYKANLRYTASTTPTGIPTWTQFTNLWKSISYDGSQLCGIDSTGRVACAAQDAASLKTIQTYPTWTTLEKKLNQVVVNKGTLFGLDTINKQLVTGSSKNLGSVSWSTIANAPNLAEISYDGLRLCAVNADTTQVQCADAALTSSPNWYAFAGTGMKAISLQREHLFALTGDYTLLHHTFDTGDDNC